MHLVLALCLAAVPDGGSDGGPVLSRLGFSEVELRVYRSAAELPAAWRAVLPADFDFRTHQLATRAGAGQPVQLSFPHIERVGEDVMVMAVEPPRQRECPPCRGIFSPLDDLSREVAAEPVRRPALHVVPRSRGRVFEREPMRSSAPPCPPCFAP